MCLLAVCNKRHFTEQEFKTSFEKNRDGFGYAYRKNKIIKFRKGFMTHNDAWDEYKRFIKLNLFPYVVHFRLGNPVCQELTHPFIVSKESELELRSNNSPSLLFHNGIVTGWENKLWSLLMSLEKIPDGKWSDTRMVAIALDKFGENIFEFINGKFVIYYNNKIKIIGDFENENGIMMSNDSHKSRIVSYYPKPNSIEDDYECYEVIL